MLKPGDIVEVRSPEEILATLDGNASLEAMPFMPEMVKYVGKRFTISHRVEKICDTVKDSGPPQSRRMHDTVLLDDLRCDGSGHDGCQAGCRIYWKESWLRRVDAITGPETDHSAALPALEERARKATHAERQNAEAVTYRCQATEASRASEPLGNFDLRQYIRELRTGNIRPGQLPRVAIRAIVGMIARRLRLRSHFPLQRSPLMERLPHRPNPTPDTARPNFNLQPGDWVEVRSPEEIAPSLNEKGLTRGLTFDEEMIPYCGGRYRVKDRVERIIDERNGQMIEIKSDCLILDGVVCSGEHSVGHWFCPRAIYPYWRENWVRPVDQPER